MVQQPMLSVPTDPLCGARPNMGVPISSTDKLLQCKYADSACEVTGLLPVWYGYGVVQFAGKQHEATTKQHSTNDQ